MMCIQETNKIDKLNLEKWAKIYNYTVYTNQNYDIPQLKHAKEQGFGARAGARLFQRSWSWSSL